MAKDRKVKITSTVNHAVGVYNQELHFNRTWQNAGITIPVEFETLQELMFDEGFKYMIDTGMLYIEDMKVKQELGIEPEGVTEPVNVIALTDKERRNYMIALPIDEFKEKIKALSYEQVKLLADYAIKNRLADFEKCKVIKEACGRDIIKSIQLNDSLKES